MRTFIGLFWRPVLFWSVLGFLSFFSLACTGALADSEPKPAADAVLQVLCLFLRWSLFVAAFTGLAFEWLQLDRFIQVVDRSSSAQGGAPGPRPERWFLRPAPLSVGWVSFTGLVLARALWSDLRFDCFAPMWALGWTLATALILALIVGRWTLWHRRGVLAQMPPGRQPRVPSTVPLVAASWNAVVLLVAFVRLPNLAWVEPLAWTAVVLARVLDTGPQEPSEEVEVLVQWPGDPGELDRLLRVTGSTAERAVPAATLAQDTNLATTWVVDVPMEQGLVLLWQLVEVGVLPEINAPVVFEAEPEGGPCPARLGGVVDDPLGFPVDPDEIGWDEALRGLVAVSRPVTLAVVDSGVAPHPDLIGAVPSRELLAGRDSRDHGTGVAGVAAAVAHNGTGVASTNLSGQFLKVLSIDALARPQAAADDVADGVWAAVEGRAKVIVLAFGAPGPAPTVVQKAIAHAHRRDVVVVAAAGNAGSDASGYWPANVPGVLVVGALDGGERPTWSNSTIGVSMAVSAPGQHVCVLTAGGDYERRSGTSYSAPLVAGLVGTYRALCPSRSREEVLRDLIDTAGTQRLGEAPMVDAAAFLARASCARGGIQGW